MRLGGEPQLAGSHGEDRKELHEKAAFKLAGVAPETVPHGTDGESGSDED